MDPGALSALAARLHPSFFSSREEEGEEHVEALAARLAERLSFDPGKPGTILRLSGDSEAKARQSCKSA
jgi:hypothetical protein